MSTTFNPTAGLVVIPAIVEGHGGVNCNLRMAIDTGATSTIISIAHLVIVGYDPTTAQSHRQITTGSGIAYAPAVLIAKVIALGKTMTNLPVLGHTLPPSAGVDGVLGLDFLRTGVLTIDFNKGIIDLT